jgi:hypothetical protein
MSMKDVDMDPVLVEIILPKMLLVLVLYNNQAFYSQASWGRLVLVLYCAEIA